MRKGLMFACVLLAPASAAAQSSITGTVTDAAGRVLPGVAVEATSGGPVEGRRAVTDGAGRYAITDLRPGEYALSFTLPGFDTARRDGIVLAAGATLPIDATLSVAPPGIDPRRARRGLVMTREMQEAIPTGRSLWSYALLIPGVRVHKPDVGGTAGVQQSEMMGRGLDAAHTTVEIDGMTVNTMISDGRYQAYLNPMLAAETSYTTSGHGAETQAGGLRINMIPNEGGDRFGGNLFVGGAPPGADNLNPRLEALGVSGPAGSTLYDVNGSFGGPILRDRLRFFTSARRNGADSVHGTGSWDRPQFLLENSLASANARLTWQVTPRHKLSAMFDKARKRRFGQAGPGVDLGTAASAWTSPHYDTGTAKWTGATSDRMLAEFGFSLSYQDWDTNYYQPWGDGPSILQARPDAADLAACFETPCFPPVGSARHAAQVAPALGGDPWYSQVSTYDGLLDLRYGAKADGENNHYTRRWAYRGSLSYVTGSHSVKVGMDFSRGRNRHTNTSNGHLELLYEDAPNPRGRLIQDQHQGLPWFDCSHPRAHANRDAGRPCGLMGTPDRVVAYNHPSNLAYQLDYNGGVYAQDSWTLDRLTLDYGMRLDFAALSVPDAPRGLGRFVPAQRQPARPSSEAAPLRPRPLAPPERGLRPARRRPHGAEARLEQVRARRRRQPGAALRLRVPRRGRPRLVGLPHDGGRGRLLGPRPVRKQLRRHRPELGDRAAGVVDLRVDLGPQPATRHHRARAQPHLDRRCPTGARPRAVPERGVPPAHVPRHLVGRQPQLDLRPLRRRPRPATRGRSWRASATSRSRARTRWSGTSPPSASSRPCARTRRASPTAPAARATATSTGASS